MSAPKRIAQKPSNTSLKTAKAAAKPAAIRSNVTPASKGAAQALNTKSAAIKKTVQESKAKVVPESKKLDAKQEMIVTAAKSMQSFCRHVLAKYEERKRKAEKEDYNALMEKLEKEAFVKLVKMQQEQAEKERAREEEEKKRRIEHLKRCKRMLEAAFDGDCNGITALLNEVDAQVKQEKFDDEIIRKAVRMKRRMMLVECEDANGNTPLSECASGGQVEAILALIEEGADPNSRGQFKRSPLYRAAFAGHLDACQMLLQHGADPRLRADDGNNAAEVTSVEAIRELLVDWDITLTERMLTQIDADKAKRNELEKRKKELEENKLEELVKAAEKEHTMRQKMFNKASDELNKRISEHDHAAAEGLVKPEITLQGIHDAEMDFEIAKLELEKASEKLAKAKLTLREQQSGEEESGSDGQSDKYVKIMIRDLHDVLMMDVGDKILNSGRWPLIIDSSGQAATFLRYRDTNYISAMSPKEMSAERIRLSLLGALRYGKILVLDMMDVDMFDTCSWRFDEVMPGLMDLIMTKRIMEEANYAKLIRKADGREYELKQFHPAKVANFRFFIVIKSSFIAVSLLERTYPIKVFMPL